MSSFFLCILFLNMRKMNFTTMLVTVCTVLQAYISIDQALGILKIVQNDFTSCVAYVSRFKQIMESNISNTDCDAFSCIL